MIAPVKVGVWNRQPAVSNVYVYTCASGDRPAGFGEYDHISVPLEPGKTTLAGHIHVTVRGIDEPHGSFFPAQPPIPIEGGGSFSGMKNGSAFVYKYDYDLSYGGVSFLNGRPYKNDLRPVSIFVALGQRGKELTGTQVANFSFVQGNSAQGNWQKTRAAKHVDDVVKQFYEDWFAQQAFWVKVEGQPSDSLALDYSLRKLAGGEEVSGKLNSSGATTMPRRWDDAEFSLTGHATGWIPATPGSSVMTASGRFLLSFGLKKP